jgi:purine-binding chemotaxis protein CheW
MLAIDELTGEIMDNVKSEPVIQLVTYQLNNETYGIDVMEVQEILRVSEIAPVPGGASYVLGIINLRGNVVTVIDTRTRFGLMSKEPDDSSRIIIIESGDTVLGIMVDSVAEVADIPESSIDSAPNVGNDETSKYIQGVASYQDNLLIVIDINRLLSEEEQADLAMF